MYQKDFILRMLEMMAELIAAILGFIKNGKFNQATNALENAYHDFLKEDASFFRKIPKEELTRELITLHNYTNGHLKILSELFFAEAELQKTQGRREISLEFYEKELTLLEFTQKESNSFSLDQQSKISAINHKITTIRENQTN